MQSTGHKAASHLSGPHPACGLHCAGGHPPARLWYPLSDTGKLRSSKTGARCSGSDSAELSGALEGTFAPLRQVVCRPYFEKPFNHSSYKYSPSFPGELLDEA